MDIKRYYNALETRLGNWVLFGGRAHLAYYDPNTWWPFPIRRALLAMEDHIYDSLQVRRPRARVLDAGCGDGQVAIHLAAKGLRVHAIDVLPQQVDRAQRNVRRAVLAQAQAQSQSRTPNKPKEDAAALDVTVRQDDYHRLATVQPASLDGVYTIETLVHASDLLAVLAELYRVLRPGGRVAFYEYDHWAAAAQEKKASVEASQADEKVREYGAIASGSTAQPDSLAQSLVQAGFRDVRETDLSRNVRPLLRVLVAVLFVPCMLVLALGVEAYFINTIAVVVNYRRGWKYVAVTGRKPLDSEE